MLPLIAFVSDFGWDDAWVGVCHAVVARSCPQARVVDLSHGVSPFDIRKGAAVAAAGVYQLPEAIHLVVVDPGVGGGRADLLIATNQGTKLVGPDNGVLMAAAWRAGGVDRAWAIDPMKVGFEGPLPTFHARDVLAPAAAALCCGVEPASLGDPLDAGSLVPSPFGPAEREGDSVKTEIVEHDRYGSLRFSVAAERIDELGLGTPELEVSLGHHILRVPFAQTFSDVSPGDPVALIDSSGWLTLAINRSSAAERYGIEPGAPAHLRGLA